MVELTMIVNRLEAIVRVRATRVEPVGKKPEYGEICKYRIDNESFLDLDEDIIIECPYGDAKVLGIEMLKAIP